MKILTIGFLIFTMWASFSSFYYVCEIRGLCFEKEMPLVSGPAVIDSLNSDLLSYSQEKQVNLIPGNLLIYFAFDKSSFEEDSSISDYFDEAMAYMLRNSASGIDITGYTDAKGSNEYNKALGYRRARSVQVYFESKGFPSDKIRIDSKGELEPVESNMTDEGRAKNRRASIGITNNN